MSADVVLSEANEGVLTLTLNRPEKRNALSSEIVHRIHEELGRADHDAGVRVVVFRGAGPDFCAGADLEEMLGAVDEPMEWHEAHAQRLGDVFIRIRRLPKPVVAVVQGRALAGGCGLATACDLIIADAGAQFGYPEIRRGFVPAMVIAMLRRAVGEKVAFDLVATGRVLYASDAQHIGLVSRVVDADEFDTEVDLLLGKLAGGFGSALALTKQQVYEVEGRSFEEAIALGAKVNAVARSTPDFRKAVEAFLKK